MPKETMGADTHTGAEKYTRAKPNFGPGLSANVGDSSEYDYATEMNPKILDVNFERLEILLMDFKSARQALQTIRARLFGPLPEQENTTAEVESSDRGALVALNELTTSLEQELKDLLKEISYLQQL